MRFAVTGSTGQLGRLVIARLKAKVPAVDIVAIARTPAKAADFGVAVREGDYERPGTWTTALAGVDTLLLISASEIGRRAAQHRVVIDAAKRAGVTRIVYTSLLHAERSPIDLAAEHRATESDLKASGIPLTLLRNGWYTENYTASIGGALAAGAFPGSAGEGKISSAARADFADAAVAAITDRGHAGRTYELAGDDAFTLGDLASEISRQTGQTIPYRNLPETEYAALLARVGVPVPFAKLIAGWDVAASKGALFDDGRQLSKLIGRPTTRLAVVVGEALKALK